MARLDDQRLTIHIRVRFHVEMSWNSLLKLRLFGGPAAIAEIRRVLCASLSRPAEAEQHVQAVVRACSDDVATPAYFFDDEA